MRVGQTGRSFEFENVQFHLLQHVDQGEPPVEIVAFHWHLKDTRNAGHNDYSHRPHLHVKTDLVQLRKAHLGVTLGVRHEEQASVDYLDSLLDDATEMFANEVLARLS